MKSPETTEVSYPILGILTEIESLMYEGPLRKKVER